MSAAVIQHVFQAVVIAKLTYASQSWSGFISVADTQHLNALLHRSIRQGFCPSDLTDITDIFLMQLTKDYSVKSYIIQTISLPLCSTRNHTHHTTSGLGAIIGDSLQKSTNFMIVISFSACCIKTCIDWQFSVCMYCILHFYIVSLVLSCVLSTENKRILYCIVLNGLAWRTDFRCTHYMSNGQTVDIYNSRKMMKII